MSRLQSVQNAAARFGVGRSTLRPHHVSATGGFQVGHSICHCPAGLQPIWPPTVSWSPTKHASCVLPHRGRALCDEPTATMMTAAGVKLWNSLPDDLHQADIERSKRLMKTFLFGC